LSININTQLIQPSTVTEIYNKLKLSRRESIFKALEKLRKNELVKRNFSENIGGYKYSLNFSKIIIKKDLTIKKIN